MSLFFDLSLAGAAVGRVHLDCVTDPSSRAEPPAHTAARAVRWAMLNSTLRALARLACPWIIGTGSPQVGEALGAEQEAEADGAGAGEEAGNLSRQPSN